MKIKRESLCNFGVFLIILIAFSKSFYNTFFGGNSGVALIIIVAVLLIFIFRKDSLKIKFNLITICWLATLFIALYNNYDLKNGDLLPVLQLVAGTLMIIFLQNDDSWCEKGEKYIKFFAVFYLVTGLILLFFKGFLISYIVPLFDMETNNYYSDSLLYQINSGFMTGLTSHYSIMGIYLSIGMCFFAGDIYNNNGKIDFKKSLGLIIMIIGTILSGKRSALIFPLLAVLITYILYFKPENLKRRMNYLLFSFIIVVCGIGVLTLIPNLGGTFGRIADALESGDINEITNKRYEMLWQPAIKLFNDSPVLGIGWGNFKHSFTKYYENQANQNNAHNVYLQVLCETGIIGTIIVMGTIFYTLYLTGKEIKKCKKRKEQIYDKKIKILGISFTMQLYFLLYSLSGNPLYDIHAYFPYMISVAMSLATINSLKKENEESKYENRNINIS